MGKKTGEIKGYLIDFGGTLDTSGCHWGKFFWQAYEQCNVGATWDDFREAYIHTERALGRGGIIDPYMNMFDVIDQKISMQLAWLSDCETQFNVFDPEEWNGFLTMHIFGKVLRQLETNRPVLARLADRAPLALVSNYYGNLNAVVEELGIKDYFRTIVESAAVGVRKPDPRIFQIALDRLGLQPHEVMVVGDSLKNDILPAHSLGCATAWLKGEGWDNDQHEPPADTHVITSLDQLLQL